MTEFETNFLGTIIGATHRTDLIDESGIKPEMFSCNFGNIVFTKANELWKNGITPNLMELSAILPTLAVEISELTDKAENIYVSGSVKQIKKDYKLRQIKKMQAVIYDANHSNFDDTLIRIQDIIDSVDAVNVKDDMTNVKDYYRKYLDHIEDRIKNKGKIDGVEIPYPLMSQIYSEFSKGCVYYYGARPSDGKSTIAMNLAYMLVANGVNVGFVSAESTKIEILNRMACHVGKFEISDIKKGNLTTGNMNAFLTVGEAVTGSNFVIYDKPKMTMADVTSAMKTMKRKYKCQIIFIDYVQRISAPKYKSKIEEVSHCSGEIKANAKILDIPIIALAQLKRDIDGGARPPNLGDFQWTSSLEQDMDGGCLIYNINPDRSNPLADDYYFLFLKNRDGLTKWVRMFFNKKYLTFEEHAHQVPPPAKAKKSRGDY